MLSLRHVGISSILLKRSQCLSLCKTTSPSYSFALRSFGGGTKQEPEPPKSEFVYKKISDDMSLVEAIHNLNKLQAHIANQFEEKRKQKGEELLDRQWKTTESIKYRDKRMAQAVKDKDHLQARMEAEGEKRVERETQLRSNITRLLVQKLGSNMSQEEISQLEKDVAALIEKNKIAKKEVREVPKDEEGVFF